MNRVLNLPKVPNVLPKNRREILAMRGINYSDQLQDGDMADSMNISAKRYPYITTRKARVKQEQYVDVTAMTAWDKLVTVAGTDLFFDGNVVGTVLPGEKQFAVVNTQLVIWPDKVFLDLNTQTVKPLGASVSGVGAVFTESSMEIAWQKGGEPVDLTTIFRAGDGITISGCTTQISNNREIVIKNVSATKITVTNNTFIAGEETGTELTLSRKIPDMDYICESENRLWGCSGKTQTIYASSLGDPTNFNVFQGLSTDSFALAVGSDGNFTGCCKLGSSVLFWKETKLHKILGSYPAEYTLYSYNIEGLRAGCHKSLQVINETLFYMGLHGVYAYSGGMPNLISQNFGMREFSDAVSGNDGDSYYLSVKEGNKKHLFVYETRIGIWIREDEIYCTGFARIGKDLYMLLDTGEVCIAEGPQDDPTLEWRVQFTPFYETIQGRKTHSKINLRLELPKGSYLTIYARFDGKPWGEIATVVGKSFDAVPVRIPLGRSDKFELKLAGRGPCTILSILREFSVESEV